jgi:hypothetical protein
MESAAVLLPACFPYLQFGRNNSGDSRLVRFAASCDERLDPWSGVIERKRHLVCSAFYERNLRAIRETHFG